MISFKKSMKESLSAISFSVIRSNVIIVLFYTAKIQQITERYNL